MTVWQDLIGQQRAVAVLSAAAEAAAVLVARRDEAPDGGSQGEAAGPAQHDPTAAMTHAWLLTGPPGSGRSNAARAFAAALQCRQSPPGCGVCNACRTTLVSSHPDVTVVATEHVYLRVEDVRPLVQLAQQAPASGRWRVIVIEDADRLGDTAGNVLLKAIEEPPPRTVWLLCAPSPDDVPVTIRSRCRAVGLRMPPPDDVAALLVRRHGVDPAIAAYAARAAGSHVGIARRLATSADARSLRREILRLPTRLGSVAAAVTAAGDLVETSAEEAKAVTAERDAAEREELLHSMGVEPGANPPPALRAQLRVLTENQRRRATRAQRDALDRALLDLASFYRDVLLLQLGAPVGLTNEDLRSDLESVAAGSPPEATLHRLEAIGLARARIGANIQPLLAVEALMVTLRSGLADRSAAPR